ncbi:MAG: chemotaxis protein CheD [candidate division WOR-3 bacterium]
MTIEFIGIGEGKVVNGKKKLGAIGIGSCLVIVIYDRNKKIGGFAHSMLPRAREENPSNPYKFVNTAIYKLLEEMEKMGCKREDMVAKIVGGARIFTIPGFKGPWSVGERNILEAREVLTELGIKIVGEDVGMDYGRSVEFDAETGEILVTSYKTNPKII